MATELVQLYDYSIAKTDFFPPEFQMDKWLVFIDTNMSKIGGHSFQFLMELC